MTKTAPTAKAPSPNKVTPVKSSSASKQEPLVSRYNKDVLNRILNRRQAQNPYNTNLVFTMGVSPSIMIAYCNKSPTASKPQRGQHAAYVWPAILLFNDATKEKREQLELSAITSRRANSSSHASIPQEPGSDYPARQFVRFVDNPEDNTIQKRRAWGRKIAKWLTELAQTKAFDYKCTFKHEKENTGDTPLLPANHVLHDKDIVQLVQEHVSHVPLEDAEFVSQFFGEDQVEHGRTVLATAKRNKEDAAVSDDDGEWWK